MADGLCQLLQCFGVVGILILGMVQCFSDAFEEGVAGDFEQVFFADPCEADGFDVLVAHYADVSVQVHGDGCRALFLQSGESFIPGVVVGCDEIFDVVFGQVDLLDGFDQVLCLGRFDPGKEDCAGCLSCVLF